MRRAILQVFAFDVASKALLALGLLLLIRFLPDTDFARYTLVTSVVSVMAATVSAAFNRVYIVGERDHQARSSSETYLAAQVACCLLLTTALAPLAGRFEGLYLWLALLMIGTCLSDFAKTYFQRELDFLRLSLVELGRTLLFVLGVGLLLVGPATLDARRALAVQSLSMLLVVAIVFAGRLDAGRLFDGRRIFRLLAEIGLREYRYVVGYFVLVAVLGNLTVFLLDALRSEYELAAYGSASKYYSMLALALAAVHVVLLPSIQKARDKAELETVLAHHRRLVPWFAAVVALVALAAGWGIPLVDGGRYPEAIPVFRLLAASAIVSFAFSPHINVLLSACDFRFIFRMMAGGVLASAGLAWPVIAHFGVLGAAWSFLVSMTVLNSIVYCRARRFRELRKRRQAQLPTPLPASPRAALALDCLPLEAGTVPAE